jgi:hypothetical protein
VGQTDEGGGGGRLGCTAATAIVEQAPYAVPCLPVLEKGRVSTERAGQL